MSAIAESSAVHESFTLERRYKSPPAKVFAAWSSAEAKARWFHGPEERHREPLQLDFRVGGAEMSWGVAKNGMKTRYDGVYLDIAPNQRLIIAYRMQIDDKPISASLMTVEFFADGAGARVRLTEQDAFLEGYRDNGSREEGTRYLLDQVAEAVGG